MAGASWRIHRNRMIVYDVTASHRYFWMSTLYTALPVLSPAKATLMGLIRRMQNSPRREIMVSLRVK